MSGFLFIYIVLAAVGIAFHLKKAAKEKIVFIDNLKQKLSYTKRKGTA